MLIILWCYSQQATLWSISALPNYQARLMVRLHACSSACSQVNSEYYHHPKADGETSNLTVNANSAKSKVKLQISVITLSLIPHNRVQQCKDMDLNQVRRGHLLVSLR